MKIPVWDEVRSIVGDLLRDRSSWVSHWREIGEYTSPRRGRFLGSPGDHNDGRKRNEKILNATPITHLGTLSAGLADGLTPRRKRWFRLVVPDPQLAALGTVQRWLYVIEDRMWQVLQRSNIYNCLGLMYGDLPRFGTAVMVPEKDPENVIHGHVVPPGGYSLGVGRNGKVAYFYREFQTTVAQIVDRWPGGTLSTDLQALVREKKWNIWRTVCHLIAPNTFDGAGSEVLPRFPVLSLYWEINNPEQRFLHAAGYHSFPVVAPRWQVDGEDVYGSCPAMDALGDIKMLQRMEKDKLELVQLQNRPPMGAPTSLKHSPRSLLSGTWTFYDSTQEHRAMPLYEPTGRLGELTNEIREVEERIKRLLKAQMFTVLTGLDRQVTAFEAEKLTQEGLQQVGPTVERLQTELLDPVIDRTFECMVHYGLVPPAPRELEGRPLRVEYVSNLANYFRRQEVGDATSWLGVVKELAELDETALDVLDTEQTTRGLAERFFVPPNFTRTAEEVAARQKQRAERTAIAEAAANAKPLADAASRLAEIEPGRAGLLDSVLTRPQVEA